MSITFCKFFYNFEDEFVVRHNSSLVSHRCLNAATRTAMTAITASTGAEMPPRAAPSFSIVGSAKLMGLDEAVFYFGFLPPKTRKILCMKKAIFPGKDETLADYYVRVHGHLLGDVYVYEITDDLQIREIRNGNN